MNSFEPVHRAPRLITLAVTVFAVFTVAAADPPGAAISYSTLPKSSNKLRVHFIDVGAGDAILIETPNPNQKHIMIDGGKTGVSSVLKPYLKHFVGDNKIALAIVTHPDYDHINGMKLVFEKYEVQKYWYTGYESSKLSDTWKELKDLVAIEPDCSVFEPISSYAKPGEWFVIDANDASDPNDDVKLQFINVEGNPPFLDPNSGRWFSESERRNNASLVVKLVYHNVSFLLTGDINGRQKEHTKPIFDEECDSVERFLVGLDSLPGVATSGFLAATVLKAPHHGSNGSSSLPFIRKVAPTWVVFCAGHEYDHPVSETMKRYETAGVPKSHMLRTDEGDSTPENDSLKDNIGDDTYVFETDGLTITKIVRVK